MRKISEIGWEKHTSNRKLYLVCVRNNTQARQICTYLNFSYVSKLKLYKDKIVFPALNDTRSLALTRAHKIFSQNSTRIDYSVLTYMSVCRAFCLQHTNTTTKKHTTFKPVTHIHECARSLSLTQHRFSFRFAYCVAARIAFHDTVNIARIDV